MDYRILGSFEVFDGSRRVAVGGGKQRALLGLLLLRANEAISSFELVDQLWQESPPPSATKILQNLISRLRRELGDGVLVTRGHAYELRVAPGEVDAHRFAEQLEQGRRALASGSHEAAATQLRAALELWRGPPLADFAYEAFARADIDRLEELRLAALVERIDADLALGGHDELLGELEGLTARYPLHERLCGQLMLALYRSGRQAEALEAYQRTRRRLAEQLGIEPGSALRQLERAVLQQEPSLEPPAREVRDATRGVTRGRRPVARAAIAAVALLAAAAVGLAVARGRTSTSPITPPTSVGVIDPATGEVTKRVGVGLLPGPIAAGAGFVWVVNTGDGTVSKISLKSERVARTHPVAEGSHVGLSAIAYGFDSVWIGDGYGGTVTPMDARLGPGIRSPIRLHPVDAGDIVLVAAGSSAIWAVSTRQSLLYRLEPVSGARVARIAVPAVPAGVAVGEGAVWVVSVEASGGSGSLARVDPATNTVVSDVTLPFAPTAVAIGFGAVWVTVNSQDLVLRIDPRTGTVEQTIEVDGGPTAIAVGADAVWVANTRAGTISRIDKQTNAVVATIPADGSPTGIAVGGGRIWVAGI